MNFQEYFPSTVITVLFCGIVPWGVDVWITADTVITTLFGLSITFFPHHFLNRQIKGSLDDVHFHIYRMCGIVLLSSSLFSWFARKSKDTAVTAAILWGRVIGVSVYVMARINGYTQTSKYTNWNHQALVFGIYGDCLWLLGNLIYALKLTKSTDMGGKPISYSKVNVYLLSDFIQCFLFGLTFFVLPKTMLGFQTFKSLNHIHATLLRMMAAFVFNTGMIAWQSVHFSQDEDKVKHFMSRIIINSVLITAQLYAQVTTSSWTNWHIYFGMIGMSLWSINSALGYFRLYNKMNKMEINSKTKLTHKYTALSNGQGLKQK